MKENKEIRFFQVTAKCGHVGRRNYVPINFPVYARSASEAAQYAKGLPRVKKHLKDAIIAVIEISEEEYHILLDANRRKPYLKAKCRRDVDCTETFVESIVHTERKWKKKKPLSEKYRYWKHVGRYTCKMEE